MNTQDEMVRGYLAGYNSGAQSLPECHASESAAFRHGWLNGLSDRTGKVHERAEVQRRRAAMILGEVA
jgi:hypothetical protein